MSNKKKTICKVFLVLFVFVVFLLCGVLFNQYYEKRSQGDMSEDMLSQAEDNIFYYEGKPYLYNQDIKNILFLGIDNDSEMRPNEFAQIEGQADCIILISINKEEKTSNLFQISRDAMTQIDLFDVSGIKYSSMISQISNQYAYGDGKESSCLAMKKTVSELLYELPIYGYFALDIAAVSVITDLLGGVELTIPEDYTEIDPAFVKGATITLNGEQAERYVRYRDTDVLGSNHLRMERQVQYIPALFEAVKEDSRISEDNFDFFHSAVSPYLVSDLTAEEMMEMMEYSWQVNKVTYLPGESIAGKKYEEFHVDDERLREILIQLFYEPK